VFGEVFCLDHVLCDSLGAIYAKSSRDVAATV
jgi:hypothetical protein